MKKIYSYKKLLKTISKHLPPSLYWLLRNINVFFENLVHQAKDPSRNANFWFDIISFLFQKELLKTFEEEKVLMSASSLNHDNSTPQSFFSSQGLLILLLRMDNFESNQKNSKD